MSLEAPKGIEALIKEDVRGEIKLNDFSKIFFPMFLAYFMQEKNVELGRWVTFTKTRGYEWVDVVKGGEVIFSVPPMLRSITLEPGRQLKQDPADIMKLAAIKDRTMPGGGNRHIRENITDVIDLTEDYVSGQDQYREAWLPIFEYYGYSLADAKKASATMSTSQDYNPEDFTEYEDL